MRRNAPRWSHRAHPTRVSGVYALVKDGRLVHVKGFGAQPAWRFRLASLSRHVTAVAIMQLVERGLLRLDTPAFSLLPHLPALPGYAEDPRLSTITLDGNGLPADDYYAGGLFVQGRGHGGTDLCHDGSFPGTATYVVRRGDGVSWVTLFDKRSNDDTLPDDAIESVLNAAIDELPGWPSGDLFPLHP